MTTILIAGLAIGATIVTMVKFDFVQFLTGIPVSDSFVFE